MKSELKVLLVFGAGAVFLCGCKKSAGPVEKAEAAVSSSYLQAAAREFSRSGSNILSINGPGMCPGHWDISPQTLEELGNCRVLLRFDFQRGMDGALERFRERGLAIEAIHAGEGLCLPETYLEVCMQVGKALRGEEYLKKIEEIRQRLTGLHEKIQQQLATGSIQGAAVICSHHQAAFCQWLGLRVAGEFGGGEEVTPGEIQKCLDGAKGQQIQFVIANRPQGTDLAEALAERLKAQVVVFDNFPERAEETAAFDRMLEKNVTALLEKTAP